MEISVVVPVYGCAGTLEKLCQRTNDALADIDHEIILVVDGPSDNSWEIVEKLSSELPVRGVRLSRNFGQHLAITAGLDAADGEKVVVMDCDLQDAPEDIVKLLDALTPEVDIVTSRRVGDYDSRIRRLVANAYTATVRFLFGVSIDPAQSALSVMRRPAVDAFLSVGDVNRQYRLIVDWIGFNRIFIDLEHHERTIGKSSYSLIRQVQLAVQGLFFFSARPLWLAAGFGLLLSLGGFISMIYVFFAGLSSGGTLGWASIFTLLLALGGVLIALTSLVGIYVGRVFQQTRGRPLFVVAETCGSVP
jgi:glycosyltransferase involved in cell wall biosynthesis